MKFGKNKSDLDRFGCFGNQQNTTIEVDVLDEGFVGLFQLLIRLQLSFGVSASKLAQGARQSIGFQFDVKDSMLGAVLKYKDLQVGRVDGRLTRAPVQHKLFSSGSGLDGDGRDQLGVLSQFAAHHPEIDRGRSRPA